jgi:hypothetical protein
MWRAGYAVDDAVDGDVDDAVDDAVDGDVVDEGLLAPPPAPSCS